jgi:hypothetical protein
MDFKKRKLNAQRTAAAMEVFSVFLLRSASHKPPELTLAPPRPFLSRALQTQQYQSQLESYDTQPVAQKVNVEVRPHLLVRN